MHRTIDAALSLPPVPAQQVAAVAWDAFVLAHPYGSAMHLRVWQAAQLDAMGVLEAGCAVVTSEGAIAAVLPLVLREERVCGVLPVRRLQSSTWHAAGPLLSLGISSNERSLVLASLDAWVRLQARSLRATRAEIAYPVFEGDASMLSRERFHPFRRYGWTERLLPVQVVDLRCSPEGLRSACRDSVRETVDGAHRQQFICRPITSRMDWTRLVEATPRAEGGIAPFTRAMMARLWESLLAPGHAFAVGVEQAGEPSTVAVIAERGGIASLLFLFNAQSGSNRIPPTIAIWEAMLTARARGARLFELDVASATGGTSAGNQELAEQFGGRAWYRSSATVSTAPLRDLLLDVMGHGYRPVGRVSHDLESRIG